MYRELIEQVRSKITTDVTAFNEVLLWNNQVDGIDLQEERNYNFPNCFIGFSIPALFKDESNGTQQSEIELTVYIVDEIYSNEFDDGTPNLDIFDLKQDVYKSLQGYTVNPQGPLSRIAEETDEDHPNLYVFKQVYKLSYLDCEIAEAESRATPTQATITGQIIVDNDIIKTSKEKFNG
jgi:hypothetical protein